VIIAAKGRRLRASGFGIQEETSRQQTAKKRPAAVPQWAGEACRVSRVEKKESASHKAAAKRQ